MAAKGPRLVFGRVVGEHLPSTIVQIGNAHLGPMPYVGSPLELSNGKFDFRGPDIDASFNYRADMQLTSNCLFWVSSSEESPEAAIQAVKNRDLPLLQAALSIRRPRDPYRLQVLWTEQDGQRQGAPVTGKFAIWTKSELEQEAIDRLNIDFALLAKDEIAVQGIRRFSEAIAQSDMCTTPIHEETVLLSLFKVLEGMSRMTPSRPPQEYEAAQDEVINTLMASVQMSENLEDRIRAIRQAHDDLDRLEGKYLSLRISAMAILLNLSDGWKQAATDFVSFRNRHLGHAGPSTTVEQRKRWLDWNVEYSAWTLARELIAGYADYKASRR
jgi:hypothetical protein